MSTLREQLASIAADHTGWPARSIADETHFYDEMGLDALDLVDMHIDVETQLGIEITDREADDINTFGDLVRCVEGKVAQPAEAVS